MCLAIPGKVEEVFCQDGLATGRVNFGGIRRITCLQYVPSVEVGDYVLVHVGFAISIIDEKEAMRSYKQLELSGELPELAAAPASEQAP